MRPSWSEYDNGSWAYQLVFDLGNWHVIEATSKLGRKPLLRLVHMKCLPTPEQFQTLQAGMSDIEMKSLSLGFCMEPSFNCAKCHEITEPSIRRIADFVFKTSFNNKE